MTYSIIDHQSVTVLFSIETIATRVANLAKEIVAKLGTNLVVIPVLKGSFMFAADLLRALYVEGVRAEVDFVMLSSYGNTEVSSGQVTVLRDINIMVNGKKLLIIDDILESGRTLAFAKDLMTARGASVTLCVLLDKPGLRATGLQADFVGFECPNHFVIGYGMDGANNCFRELPFIGTLSS